MKAEPILAETYRIKEMLAAKAGYSIQRLCEQIEKSMSLHPSPAPQVFSAEELAALVARGKTGAARGRSVRMPSNLSSA
jgi:hypothetical protein